MWNPFRGKTKTGQAKRSQPAGQRANCVEDLANTLQREGRIGELERKLKGLEPSSLSPREQESWWRLYGIAAFREGRDAEAMERFQEAHKRFPDSAEIRFSLGQQYLRAQEEDRAFQLFRTCSFPEIPREYALVQARYAYLRNRYDDGLSFIRPFFQAYKELKILDDSFLYVRGLPFFGRWWSCLAAFAALSGQWEELEEVTAFVIKNCHDYDFDYLQAELKACRTNNPEHLLEAVGRRLSEMGNFPTGYTQMHLAVIRARMATILGNAQEILGGVALSKQDFPWLEDIRTLALAEAAHRLGDSSAERDCVRAFLVHQPMLFEPDIALSFHLLLYQERLKPRASLR